MSGGFCQPKLWPRLHGSSGAEIPMASRTERLSFRWAGSGKAASTQEQSIEGMVASVI